MPNKICLNTLSSTSNRQAIENHQSISANTRSKFGRTLKKILQSSSIAVAFVAASHNSFAQVVISEFMAKNDATLVDGDGAYSDWIELYNTGTESVDLTGWFLSDDEGNLQQWSFPATSIAAEGRLVIFASGQDGTAYTDSLGYLHTTFKLSASGESVVLTQSDGVTIEDSILDYPEQDDDVSYGLAQDSDYTYLIVEEQDATAFIGTSEPSASWTSASFNDAAWLSGQTGVGFEETGSTSTGGGGGPGGGGPGGGPGSGTTTTTTEVYGDLINLDLAAMSGSTDSAYIRVAFTLDGTEDISQLSLRMKYDDGFVAYVNGVQVASANAPDSPTYQSSANEEHDAVSYEDFTIFEADTFLQTGENVLAIHGLNDADDTTDFFIMPVLTGITVGEVQLDTFMYFQTPTPGYDNVSGILGYVEDTNFSVDRGFYSEAFNVAITCDTVDASIRYTIDGTTPATDNGTLYTGAITIDQTTVLRAAAFVTGYQSSDVDTQTYIFLDDIIAQGISVTGLDPEFPTSAVNGQDFDYGMDTDVTLSADYSDEIEGALLAIPSISIVTDPDNLFDATSGIYVNADESGELWERETSVELINPDATEGFQINGGIRIRGASSTTSSNPKHSFRLLFRSEYGESRLNYSLFGDDGADSFKRMDLRTGQNFSWANQTPAYATWLYDIFSRDTHRDMNQPYTRGEYYHLYINGMYWGLYQTEERCESNFAESYYGDDSDDFDAVKADADSGDLYAVDGTRDAYEDLWTGIDAGVTNNEDYFALQGMNSDGSENSSYTKLLDVDNVIDYMLLTYFTANRDSPVGPPMNSPTMPRNLTSVYNRTNPDGFKYVAHDNEHSLEISEGVNHNRFNTSLISSFDGIDRMTPWWMNLELMANDEYALRFADHVHEHFFNDGELTATKTAARMETRKNEIYSAVVAESARWGDSAGTLRTRDDDWLTWADWLTDTYMAQRTDIVFAQIVAKGWYPSVSAPILSQHGGSFDSGLSLSMTGSGTIYYTTDGSDPREVGGAVAGNAYSSALSLEASTQIKARVLSGGTWSALTKASFILNEDSPLRVTEIMYHTTDPTTAAEAGYDSSDFEFIELQNTGAKTIGLTGIQFTQGIYFDFTQSSVPTLDPGEYVVLVSNLEAFALRYSNWESIAIAGEYHGKFFRSVGELDNSGETIAIEDGFANSIQTFDYNDWYPITDGGGYSLTLIDSTADTSTWNDSASWRPSAYSGGTPGEGPVEFPATGDLMINELLTHQDQDDPGDWIELYNSSSNTLDINGWYLSDDADNLSKLELSGLSTIAPGEYFVLTEADHFGATVAGANAFALSELGETVYLSSAENGELTGYRIEQSFDAAERDVTFGLYQKTDGTYDLTAQEEPTLGAVNSGPAIGPIVITDIMYHPSDIDAFEYIQICNTGSTSVALYHETYTSNTWSIQGAVEFTFPEGLVLTPGNCIIISETDADAFELYYAVAEETIVLGPYVGKLDNGGETIILTKPGDPEELTGEVPSIVVEWVNYDDDAPWPTDADGIGDSLLRLDDAAYSNDYINWNASSSYTIHYVPESWFTSYGIDYTDSAAFLDSDFDGALNWEEYEAGTSPVDASLVFKITGTDITSDQMTITWSAVTGKSYAIEYKENLLDTQWTTLQSGLVGVEPEMNAAVSMSGEIGFIRVSVE